MASSSMTTSSTPSPVVKQEPSVENYFPLNLGNQRPSSQMGSHPMHQQGRPMSRSPAMTPTPAAMTPLPPSRTPAPHTPSPLDPLRTPGLSPAQTPQPQQVYGRQQQGLQHQHQQMQHQHLRQQQLLIEQEVSLFHRFSTYFQHFVFFH